MGNRKAAEEEVYKYIEKILPGSENVALYQAAFKKMSDAQFEAFIVGLEDDSHILSIISPNLAGPKLDLKRNMAVAKELGHDFFQRLWLTDSDTGTVYLTPLKYLVMDLPLRRQVQLLVKKSSIPEDNKHIDELTGQPTGASKGSKVSFPELQVLYAQGLEQTIVELMKYRAGDAEGFNAMNRSIMETGGASLEALAKTPTRVKSVVTLATLLKGMHLSNTLAD